MRNPRAVASQLYDRIGNALDSVGGIVISLSKPILVILHKRSAQVADSGGLRGRLILIGIAVILWPLLRGLTVFVNCSQFFSNGTWKQLITPGTVAYVPSLGIALLGSLILNIALIFASLYLIYLFFSKKKAFQKWSVGIGIGTFLFALADLGASHLIDPRAWVSGVTVWEMSSTMFKWFVPCAIWVSYVLVSRRVKATFVK